MGMRWIFSFLLLPNLSNYLVDRIQERPDVGKREQSALKQKQKQKRLEQVLSLLLM